MERPVHDIYHEQATAGTMLLIVLPNKVLRAANPAFLIAVVFPEEHPVQSWCKSLSKIPSTKFQITNKYKNKITNVFIQNAFLIFWRLEFGAVNFFRLPLLAELQTQIQVWVVEGIVVKNHERNFFVV